MIDDWCDGCPGADGGECFARVVDPLQDSEHFEIKLGFNLIIHFVPQKCFFDAVRLLIGVYSGG